MNEVYEFLKAAKTYYPQRVAEVYQMKGGEP